MDVSAVVAEIEGTVVAIAAIGAAVVGGPVVVKAAWRWIRGAIG